jgi:hypothetical protein
MKQIRLISNSFVLGSMFTFLVIPTLHLGVAGVLALILALIGIIIDLINKK